MPFRKKALYYGLMLFLTLLVLEGMARLAYYAAYGQWYGRGGLNTLSEHTPPPPKDFTGKDATPWEIRHPFYGYVRNLPDHDLNAMPPRPRRADTVVVGLLGGSVAREVQPFLQRALNHRFAANELPRQPIVLNLTAGAAKQPQQPLIAANALLLGGEFDLLVNLDGFNELYFGAGPNFADGVSPTFPVWWRHRVGPSTGQLLLRGQIGILRREQARLAAVRETSPLRRSALFGLLNRWRQERAAAAIIRRHHELAAIKSAYNLEQHGPPSRLAQEELLSEMARVWYRGSLTLSRLAELAGAEYYHFLQPNQYLPSAKPLTPQELALVYNPGGQHGYFAERGYPLLRRFSGDLQKDGVNYFDLTGIFAGRRETLYRDDCCHLNRRGNELLAAAMVQRMAPALRRRAALPDKEPVSPLAAARRPALPDSLLAAAHFRVYRAGDGRWLRYVRDNCVPADIEPRFFLHLTPRAAADLPPGRQQHGFDNRDFGFGGVGGFLWRGQCRVKIRLPDYPIAYLRTGQYAPGQGELWSVKLMAAP